MCQRASPISIEANPKRAKAEVCQANVSIRQMGNLAWAEYDSILKFDDGEEKSHEYRSLVNEGMRGRSFRKSTSH